MSAQSLLSILAPAAPTPSKGATDSAASGFQDLLGSMMGQIQVANDGDAGPQLVSGRVAAAGFLIAPPSAAQQTQAAEETALAAILPTDLLPEGTADTADQPVDGNAEAAPSDELAAAATTPPVAPPVPAKTQKPAADTVPAAETAASIDVEAVTPILIDAEENIEAAPPPAGEAAPAPQAAEIPSVEATPAIDPTLVLAVHAPATSAGPIADTAAPNSPANTPSNIPGTPPPEAAAAPVDTAPVPADPLTAPAPGGWADAGERPAPRAAAATPQQTATAAAVVAPKPKARDQEAAPAAAQSVAEPVVAGSSDALAEAEAPAVSQAAPKVEPAPKAEAAPMRALAERTSRPLEADSSKPEAVSAAKPAGVTAAAVAVSETPRLDAPAKAPTATPALEASPVDVLAPEQTTAGHTVDPASAAGAAQAVEAPTPQVSRAAIDATAQIAAQIIRRLDGRSTRFEMALMPDDLGRVDVKLDIDSEGRLAARLAFDNPLAATDLRGRADELRRQLEDAGFQVSDSALEFAERDSSSSAFDRGHEQRGGQGRAFAAASRLNAETDIVAQPPRWTALSLSPSGVDLKV